MTINKIKSTNPLGPQWQTRNPFLFCAHHDDKYPKGNGKYGPDKALLAGRNMGNDFVPKDGWRMYHGHTVPGFPVHPHRGFETVTYMIQGAMQHEDSAGNKGDLNPGDVQWMTAGRGIIHSELPQDEFLKTGGVSHGFQIWVNLPAKDKMMMPPAVTLHY